MDFLHQEENIMDKHSKIQQMAVIGVMAAVICILGPMSIPIGVVPVSFTMFAIYLSIYALGMWRSCVSYLIYLLIGIIGLPVFSGYTSGPAKLFGPTGGYLLSFILIPLIAGFFIDHFEKWYMSLFGLLLAIAVCYAAGTLWLAYQAGMSMQAALAAGVIPFIPADIVKIAAALMIGPVLRKQLRRAGFYPGKQLSRAAAVEM
jgi:biotin transport system substrate-specific component